MEFIFSQTAPVVCLPCKQTDSLCRLYHALKELQRCISSKKFLKTSTRPFFTVQAEFSFSFDPTYAFNNSVSTTYPFNNSVFTTYPYIKSVATTLPFSAFRQVSTDKKKKDQKQHLKILPLVLKPFISSLLTAIPILPLTSTRQSQHAPYLETYLHNKSFSSHSLAPKILENHVQGSLVCMKCKSCSLRRNQ